MTYPILPSHLLRFLLVAGTCLFWAPGMGQKVKPGSVENQRVLLAMRYINNALDQKTLDKTQLHYKWGQANRSKRNSYYGPVKMVTTVLTESQKRRAPAETFLETIREDGQLESYQELTGFPSKRRLRSVYYRYTPEGYVKSEIHTYHDVGKDTTELTLLVDSWSYDPEGHRIGWKRWPKENHWECKSFQLSKGREEMRYCDRSEDFRKVYSYNERGQFRRAEVYTDQPTPSGTIEFGYLESGQLASTYFETLGQVYQKEKWTYDSLGLRTNYIFASPKLGTYCQSTYRYEFIFKGQQLTIIQIEEFEREESWKTITRTLTVDEWNNPISFEEEQVGETYERDPETEEWVLIPMQQYLRKEFKIVYYE